MNIELSIHVTPTPYGTFDPSKSALSWLVVNIYIITAISFMTPYEPFLTHQLNL